jgi:hypothetical protein
VTERVMSQCYVCVKGLCMTMFVCERVVCERVVCDNVACDNVL